MEKAEGDSKGHGEKSGQKANGEAEINPALQIPCVITKISTLQSGGWNVTIHVPEIGATQIKALVGTENQQAFIMLLVKDEGKGAMLPTATKPCKKATKRTISQP